MSKLNKKGFTFIEILAVVALMAIIVLVAVPSIMLVKSKINLRLYNTKKNLILSAAELYAQDENITLTTEVKVQTLLDDSYIKPDEKANGANCPQKYTNGCVLSSTKKSILNNTYIKITVSKNKTYTATCNTWPE